MNLQHFWMNKEEIGKTLPPGNNQVEMDNLILDEILAAQGSSMGSQSGS